MDTQISGVKTKTQMADEYGVCRKTFVKQLKQKQIKLDNGLIYPKDQVNIYNKLGLPSSIEKFPLFPNNSH